MSESPSLTLSAYAKVSLVFAGLLLLPALWSFVSAIVSAASTGQVLVISLGRTSTARELVPWLQGWPRFVAPMLILASLLLWVSSEQLPRGVWWTSAAISTLGFVLLLFSMWFTSWRGALSFFGLVAFIATALYVGNRFGRIAAVAFILLVFSTIVWRTSSAA
jgi:hypothetical protein